MKLIRFMGANRFVRAGVCAFLHAGFLRRRVAVDVLCHARRKGAPIRRTARVGHGAKVRRPAVAPGDQARQPWRRPAHHNSKPGPADQKKAMIGRSTPACMAAGAARVNASARKLTTPSARYGNTRREEPRISIEMYIKNCVLSKCRINNLILYMRFEWVAGMVRFV